MLNYIKLFRCHQYIKNSFIFVSAFFSLTIIDNYQVLIIVFILFSLLASSVYILNDIIDCKKDQQHPYKRLRPIAKGVISRKKAMIISIILTIIVLLGAYYVSQKLFYLLLFYYGMNVMYSLGLKKNYNNRCFYYSHRFCY